MAHRGYCRITKIYDWGVSSASCSTSGGNSFTYDDDSDLLTSSYANGVADTRTYDADDAMIQTQTAKGATVYGTFAYTRDSAEQLASTATSGTNLVPAGTEDVGYDSLQQVSGTSGATSRAYSYDSGDSPTRLDAAYQSFDIANELCWQSASSSANPCATPPTGATTYSYDAEGNRHAMTVSSTTTTYGYDQQDRLTSVSGGATASYIYMADGTRLSKTIGGVTAAFTYSDDGGTPLLLSAAGGGATSKYLYGPDGQPFEQNVGSTTTYLSHDQIGSTRILTDTSGNETGTYSYDPYGNTTNHTGTVTSNLQYAGQFLDTETGYYYLQARYYDPATGQFITRDSAYDNTLDAYGYVGNDPLNGTDPLGLCSGITSAFCTLGKVTGTITNTVGQTATAAWNGTGGRFVHVVSNSCKSPKCLLQDIKDGSADIATAADATAAATAPIPSVDGVVPAGALVVSGAAGYVNAGATCMQTFFGAASTGECLRGTALATVTAGVGNGLDAEPILPWQRDAAKGAFGFASDIFGWLPWLNPAPIIASTSTSMSCGSR